MTHRCLKSLSLSERVCLLFACHLRLSVLSFSHLISGGNDIEKKKNQMMWFKGQESPFLERVRVVDGSNKYRTLTQESRLHCLICPILFYLNNNIYFTLLNSYLCVLTLPCMSFRSFLYFFKYLFIIFILNASVSYVKH